MSMSERVRVGRITAAHGVRGDVKIRCFTETPEDVGAYGPLRDALGRTITLASVRSAKGPFVVARIADVADRNAAEALVGCELFVPRDRLPAPEPDEWYYADLIGLAAASGKPFMVPFTAACVPDINVADRAITIIPLRDADED